ncbi:MAG TPA: protein-disulfide reductase DsbD domain-containing protein [Thermoanaerobaculia bacterium]|jgi:DsbC/DsbD-like thiol-disulfide interchange protein|nr:protein-disulfide reductase DsbD domain-containing protein [Thermoanaerobaculia bacterium]
MTAPKIVLLPLAALLLVLFLVMPSPARGAAGEWSTNPQSRVRLISPWQVAPRNGELMLGLHFLLSPGWHVYWKNSGDAGFPPSATFQPAEVLGAPEILWPTPRRFQLPGDLVAFGYEDEVVYPVRAEIKPGIALPATPAQTSDAASSDPAPPAGILHDVLHDVLHITADLDYLVCQVDCIPFRYTLTLDQPLGDAPEGDPATATLVQTWVDRLPRIAREIPGVRTGAVLDASRQGGPDLEIRVLGVQAQAGKTDLFLEPHETFDAGRPRMRAVADGLVFHVPVRAREAGKPLPEKTSIAWTISNLTAKDGKPFNLEARREVPVWTQGGAAPDPMREPAAGGAADRFPRQLLRAFLGGALMNLAPTVLALLIAAVFSLRLPGTGSRAGLRGTGLRENAAAAVTGVVGGCWAIAGLALLGRRAGVAADWPSLLQEPAVGALLAIAAALLALNLWGLLELPLPSVGATRAGTGRHLLAGLSTVPLALAWPVPLLQEPIGAAFAHGPAAVCAVFAMVGFGLALPYLLLTLVPGLAGRLPVPGAWLPRLREGLGFLAGGSTLWLLYALSRRVSPEGLAWIELALLGMSLLAWLRSREGARPAARFVFVLGLAACAAGALWLADHDRLTPRRLAPRPATVQQPMTSNTIQGG